MKKLTTGRTPSIRAIAQREGLPNSYVSRVLHGSLLAPDIIEQILKGSQPIAMTVEALRAPPPLAWEEQRRRFGTAGKAA
jgi:cystathionine beta-lyase family protein involved in aluminum resistance